ncbi:YdaS family helix-turn-helix protein [Pseudomonas sp. zfem002]|uniref:transcriptional regulator n=1 Tax=Pseudomonas sp. zfem002 TaxID=3078197 RepID=UPI00292773C5|nr:YdaS family helix-turn-helix protein [Pseudomonas sp. zfem002]MDU9391905.1 YdaS family helix-turn-helix protein [Pseudomonas sp. zfem002]
MRTKHTKLLEWLKTATDADIEKTGTTRGYLKQIAYGNKQASARVASSLEKESSGALTRQSLRPNDWTVIWPELVSAA